MADQAHLDKLERARLKRWALAKKPKPKLITPAKPNVHKLLPQEPNIIGAHEVEPIRCPECGEPIPWTTIRERS